MAEVTIYDVYDALGLTAENGTQTLINSIRNGTELAGMTEVFDGTIDGLRNFGVAVNRTGRTQNVFVNELVDRIGKVIINQVALRDPLARFKKGRITEGRMVQDIFADLIKAQAFNPEDAAETLFKRSQPNVRVLFHDTWRKEIYPNTIERTTLEQAFTSFDKLEQFIVTTYNAQYNSNEVDQFLWGMLTIQNYVANGYAHYVQVPQVTDETTGKEFVKKTRATSTKLTLTQGSRKYNAMGVHTTTQRKNLWLIIDADLDATLDVDVLAKAFNMDKTTIEKQKIVVENFNLDGLQAILFDAEILKFYDKEFFMNSVENVKGLYINTFLHVHQMFSMGKFQNLVAFMSDGIPPVTKLIMTPMSSYIKLNEEKEFTVYADFEKGFKMADFDVTTTIVDGSGSAVTGVTATYVASRNVVKVLVTKKELVDQDLTVSITLTQKQVEGVPAEPFVRSTSSLVVPLPETEK